MDTFAGAMILLTLILFILSVTPLDFSLIVILSPIWLPLLVLFLVTVVLLGIIKIKEFFE